MLGLKMVGTLDAECLEEGDVLKAANCSLRALLVCCASIGLKVAAGMKLRDCWLSLMLCDNEWSDIVS